MTKTIQAGLSRAAPIMMLGCVLGAPSVARGQTAAEIVEAHIKASGGEQAIARIENFTSKGRVTVESPFFGKLEGFEMDVMKVQSFANPFIAQRALAPAGLQIERLDDAQVSGKPHYVLVVKTANGPSATMFIDRETKLLTRSTMTVSIPTVGEASIMTDVGGYKTVAGVMMSTTMTQVVEGIATTNVTFDDTSVNTAVDAKIFVAR